MTRLDHLYRARSALLHFISCERIGGVSHEFLDRAETELRAASCHAVANDIASAWPWCAGADLLIADVEGEIARMERPRATSAYLNRTPRSLAQVLAERQR